MFRQITCVLTVILVSCGVFLWSATDVAGQNYSPLYDEVLKKLESLAPNNTIEVNLGVEENRYQERFTITDETLKKLEQAGVPEAIMMKLADLKNSSYSKEVITEKIGDDQTAKYQALILKQSDYEIIPVYQTNDPFELYFQVSQDSYIVLMHIAGREINFLVPNRTFPDGRIKGGKVYSTLQDFQLGIKATLPEKLAIGTDIINLFCSSQKIVLFKPDFGAEPPYKISPSDEEPLKMLLDRVTQLKQEEWSGKSLKIEIRRSGARGLGSMFSSGGIPSDRTRKWFPPIGSAGTTGIK
jgi:hypothetical protein